MHCNYVLRLHAHAKHLPPTHVPLFGLACGHNMMAALRVIIAILRCKTDCVAACRASAVLPYVVATAVLSASRHPPPHPQICWRGKSTKIEKGERGKLAATHRRWDGFGRIPVNQACARSGWPGPGSAQSKNVHGSRLRLRCIPIALPREIGLRLANACRGLLSGNSSGALGPLVIGSADPILCVAPWFDGRSRSV